MFSLIFMKLKSHDCIPDYLGKRSSAEHSLGHFFENTMSYNNPGTRLCRYSPSIFPGFISYFTNIHKYANETILLQVHDMTELVKLYQRCNKNHHNVDFWSYFNLLFDFE